MHHAAPASASLVVVYDGDCPFCAAYMSMVRLRAAAGDVRLVNARDGGVDVARVRAAGYDLNDGMAALVGNDIYHGADCMTFLALQSTRSGLFNRLNHWVFSRPRLARLLYPILRSGRNATLRLLRRRPIEQG